MSEKKSRILWRCRRGIKEMDIVLQDFIKNSYDELNNENKSAFSKLLEEQDLDILNWVLGKDKPEDKTLIEIIKKLKTIDKKKKFIDEIIWNIYWKGYLEITNRYGMSIRISKKNH